MPFDLAQDEDTQSYYYMYLPPATYTTPTVAVNFAGGSTVDRTATNLLIERSKYAIAADYFQTLFSGGGELGAHTGTAANPYLIRNGNDLVELAAKVNSTDAAYSSATSALIPTRISIAAVQWKMCAPTTPRLLSTSRGINSTCSATASIIISA